MRLRTIRRVTHDAQGHHWTLRKSNGNCKGHAGAMQEGFAVVDMAAGYSAEGSGGDTSSSLRIVNGGELDGSHICEGHACDKGSGA